jgi:hypothetical protein
MGNTLEQVRPDFPTSLARCPHASISGKSLSAPGAGHGLHTQNGTYRNEARARRTASANLISPNIGSYERAREGSKTAQASPCTRQEQSGVSGLKLLHDCIGRG